MEIVDENSAPLLRRPRSGRPIQYNWDKWLQNNKTVRLVQGEDFACKPASMRMQTYNMARLRGGKATVHIGIHPDADKAVIEITYVGPPSSPTQALSAPVASQPLPPEVEEEVVDPVLLQRVSDAFEDLYPAKDTDPLSSPNKRLGPPIT